MTGMGKGMLLTLVNTLLLLLVLWRLNKMAGDFAAEVARLQDDIAELILVEDAAILLIENLALQIRANMNDPVALDAIASQLEAQKDRLAAAVAANTPAAPAPIDAPVADDAAPVDAPVADDSAPVDDTAPVDDIAPDADPNA
jgi:hypothetical protein